VIEKESFLSPWSAGLFARELESSLSVCLAARLHGAAETLLVGYIIFWMILDEIHLHNLAVGKKYRRRGIAERLLQSMQDMAAKNGLTALTLEVRESNDAAIHLYQKHGFIVKGIRPHYYTDTDENALIMWTNVSEG